MAARRVKSGWKIKPLTWVILVAVAFAVVFFACGLPSFGRPSQPASPSTGSPQTAPVVVSTQVSAPTQAPARPSIPDIFGRNTAPRLPVSQMAVVPFAPYDVAILATENDTKYGVEIEVVNVVKKSEVEQCQWVLESPNRILHTTINSGVMCPGTKIVMIVGQSAGIDAIVVKPQIKVLTDIYKYPITGVGSCSVSEYFAKSSAYVSGQRNQIAWDFKDTPEAAVEEWLDDTKGVMSLVAWKPYTDDVLKHAKAPPGSYIVTDSSTLKTLLDVWVVKATPEPNPVIQSSMMAWFDALNYQMEKPAESWDQLVKWRDSHGELGKELVYSADRKAFEDELKSEAQAPLNINTRLFFTDSPQDSMLYKRISQVAQIFGQFPCESSKGVNRPIPRFASPGDVLDVRYLEKLRNDSRFVSTASPLNRGFVTAVVPPLSGNMAQASAELFAVLPGQDINFLPNSTDLEDEQAATDTIRGIYLPLLESSTDVILEFTGAYALPKDCGECTPENGRSLAPRRAQVIVNLLLKEKVDPNRVRLALNPDGTPKVREPIYTEYREDERGDLIRLDRQAEVRGYKLRL